MLHKTYPCQKIRRVLHKRWISRWQNDKNHFLFQELYRRLLPGCACLVTLLSTSHVTISTNQIAFFVTNYNNWSSGIRKICIIHCNCIILDWKSFLPCLDSWFCYGKYMATVHSTYFPPNIIAHLVLLHSI